MNYRESHNERARALVERQRAVTLHTLRAIEARGPLPGSRRRADELALMMQAVAVRDLGPDHRLAGTPEKRAAYLCEKWCDRGWAEWVSPVYPYMLERGREAFLVILVAEGLLLDPRG
jgi:hypothetical protein